MRMVVVLPAPFGPSKARIAPSGTRRETCETAVNVPKRLVKSYVSINLIFAFRSLGLSCLLHYYNIRLDWLSPSGVHITLRHLARRVWRAGRVVAVKV